MTEYQVSVLFDWHGTLVDSVYQHVAACQQALHAARIEPSVWRIHRRIGMSGGLFAEMLLREGEGLLSAATVRKFASLSCAGSVQSRGQFFGSFHKPTRG